MAPLEPNNKPLSLPRPTDGAEAAAPRLPLAGSGAVPLAAADAQSAPGLNEAPTMTALIRAVRRRWLFAGGLAILGAAAAVGLVWSLVPSQYTAEARLLVDSRAKHGVLVRNDEETDFTMFKNNQAALLTSPLLLSKALNQEEIRSLALVRQQVNPAVWLEKALKVDFLLGPEIMRVSLSGSAPEELAPLVNAVVDTYVGAMAAKENTRQAALLSSLKKNQDDEEKKLRQRQQALRTLEVNLGLDDAPATLAKLQAGLAELTQMKRELRDLERKVNDARTVPAFQIEAHLKQDPAAKELLKRRAEAEKTIADIRRTAQPHLQEKLLEGVTRELEALNRAYESLLNDLRPRVEKELREEGQERVAQLQRQQTALVADIGRVEEETKQMKRATVEVDAARRAIQQAEAALNELGKQIAALSLEPALGPRISKLQDAETPRTADMGRQVKFAGVAGLSVFGLMLFGVAFREYRVRRINAVDEVAQGLGLAVVGTLPALPARARRAMARESTANQRAWRNGLNESMDAIRTWLLHAARTDKLQVVMVTSAAGGEGKTSVASHLAASLARAWRKTLLVDGDLRKPAAHQAFDMPLEPGLSEVLRGEVNLDEAIRPTPLSRLWLMPAGHWDSHAVQALAQDGVKGQLARLKEHYDFIIVDSCPVLPVADSLLLGQHVDAVVFSILRDVSRMPTVRAAQQRLSGLGIRTLGAVVIGAVGDADCLSYEYPIPVSA
jgi:capsular exopolysaccharide synthesis family protein